MKKRPPAYSQDYIYLQPCLPLQLCRVTLIILIIRRVYGQRRYITANMIEQCEVVKELHQTQYPFKSAIISSLIINNFGDTPLVLQVKILIVLTGLLLLLSYAVVK